MNPDLDLTIERVIRAPRAALWQAWTDPQRLAKWVAPGAAHTVRRAAGGAARRRPRDAEMAEG